MVLFVTVHLQKCSKGVLSEQLTCKIQLTNIACASPLLNYLKLHSKISAHQLLHFQIWMTAAVKTVAAEISL